MTGRFDGLAREGEIVLPDLRIESIADLAAVALDDPGWLARPIWPGDAYGIIGAAFKAGKTWMVVDLAVSTASGGLWCGVWPTPTRRVLVFLSEGGRRKMLRRFRAVADAKGVDLADLPIRFSLRAPRVVNLLEVSALRDEIAEHRPGLIMLDPWYLSAPGVHMADLVRVGEVLAQLQDLAQEFSAALVVSHHWNQTGEGTGARRFSGAGMAEWGRVLMSVGVAAERTTETSSTVTLNVEISGDEIPARTVILRRHVEVVGDVDDLTAPFRYRCEQVDVPIDLLGKSNAHDRVLAVLRRRVGDWLTAGQIGDMLAAWGLPLKARTIREAAGKLVDEHEADEADVSANPADGKQWIAT